MTTFLVTLGWLGPLLSTIFVPPGRSGHSWGVAGAPQEDIPTLPGRSSTALGWVLWHAQKVAGSMQKAILAYFGTLPHPPKGFPGGTLHQNPRFFVSRCAYLARARRYVRSTLNGAKSAALLGAPGVLNPLAFYACIN